jgi:mannose-1-phosphate guanylyltransferase / mannose-6-phosphate isomerase
LLLEPVGRNTGPAIAVAALHAVNAAPDAILIVQPADHALTDSLAFQMALEEACQIAASEGRIVLLGARPTRPETGYGYIECGEELNAASSARQVRRFVEKPAQELAARFVQSGAWLWNIGTFVFSAATILEELARLKPSLLESCRTALLDSTISGLSVRLDRDAFAAAESISIDHAVMERSQRLAVVPVDCGWTDLGSWAALWDIENRDHRGNVTHGDVLCRDTEQSYLRSDRGLLVSIGLRDVVVVSTGDAVLVADKSSSQEIKAAVEMLSSRREVLESPRCLRPWGSYEIAANGDGFKVKRIIMGPREQTSLHLHHNRSEHLVVISGTALMQVGEQTLLRHRDESTFVPAGAKHRVANAADTPLEVIEVQVGTNLREADIVRFDDAYGRV